MTRDPANRRTVKADRSVRDGRLAKARPCAAAVAHLADYELRFYASRGYLEQHGTPASLEELRDKHDLIWYVDALLDVAPLRILEELVPRARARLQTNNITGHHSAARAGLGVALLPTYIGATDPSLVGVLPEQLRIRRTYWLVVPRDLTELLRVREITAALHALVAAHPHLETRGADTRRDCASPVRWARSGSCDMDVVDA